MTVSLVQGRSVRQEDSLIVGAAGDEGHDGLAMMRYSRFTKECGYDGDLRQGGWSFSMLEREKVEICQAVATRAG